MPPALSTVQGCTHLQNHGKIKRAYISEFKFNIFSTRLQNFVLLSMCNVFLLNFAASLYKWYMYILYTGKYSPRFIFAPFALVISERIYDWANFKNISNNCINYRKSIYFFLSCLGEFKTAMGGTICKCRTAKITRCENNTVHSRFLQIL